jgi:glycosyltransferase 2 family protein
VKAHALGEAPHGDRWWTPATRRATGRTLAVAFALLVVWLIFDYARDVDWDGVLDALADYAPARLAAAAAVVVASHLVYSCYDLVGQRYAGHLLPLRKTLGIAFVSYAFNLNFGSVVGGVAFRLRLYTRLGLRAAEVVRIILLSLATNWSGWLLLAGATLTTRQLELPPSFELGAGALQALGVVMASASLGYVALCAFSRRREFRIRHHRFTLPNARMAAIQVGLGALNWALMAVVVWTLMPDGIGYGMVLATLLTACIAAIPTHIPGGLGVLEGVFVLVLGTTIDQASLIAALLAYRALYYLAPLAIAALLYPAIELHARRMARRNAIRSA